MSGKPANKDLLKFLFDDSQQAAQLEAYLEMLSEESGHEEELKSKKTPLEKALKAVDVSTSGLTLDPIKGYVLTFDNSADYQAAKGSLESAEGMGAIAELGWVMADDGETDSLGAGKYKMTFIELLGFDDEPSHIEKAADLEQSDMEKVAKDSFDFVNGDFKEREDEKPTQDKGKGVGDAKDGSDPKGKPKGGKANEAW